MSRDRPSRRRRPLAFCGLAPLIRGSTRRGALGGHGIGGHPVDPEASVTYQQNPAHDGGYVDSSFAAPLRRVPGRSTSVEQSISGHRRRPGLRHDRPSRAGDDVEALS
jgi:hypothetical protein